MCRHFLMAAYHELGVFPLLDTGRGNLEEQFGFYLIFFSLAVTASVLNTRKPGFESQVHH